MRCLPKNVKHKLGEPRSKFDGAKRSLATHFSKSSNSEPLNNALISAEISYYDSKKTTNKKTLQCNHYNILIARDTKSFRVQNNAHKRWGVSTPQP